jgi:hypothetical protein
MNGPDPHNVELATDRLTYAGPTTGLKSVFDRLYERRPLADFRLVIGPAYVSRSGIYLFAKLKNFFAKLIFFPPKLFLLGILGKGNLSEQKKNWREKNQLSKTIFPL